MSVQSRVFRDLGAELYGEQERIFWGVQGIKEHDLSLTLG